MDTFRLVMLMASTLVITSIDSDPVKVFQSAECKQAVTDLAKQLASKANSLSAGFRTGLFYPPGEKEPLEGVGNKQPKYGSKSAINCSTGCVALVVEKNYAAIKDNHLHNTLRKVL